MYLAQTLVCLAGQLLGSPSGHHTLESLTLGGSDHVDLLVLGEHSLNRYLLLELVDHKVDLVGSCSTIDLDLSHVCLLLANVDSTHLGVGDGTDNHGVLPEFVQLLIDGRLLLCVLLGVLCEGLLLGAVPPLVESAASLIADVLGPDSTNGTKTSWSLDVTNNTNDDDRRGLEDGDGLNNFLLVHLCVRR